MCEAHPGSETFLASFDLYETSSRAEEHVRLRAPHQQVDGLFALREEPRPHEFPDLADASIDNTTVDVDADDIGYHALKDNKVAMQA